MRLFKKPQELNLNSVSVRLDELNKRMQNLEYNFKALKNRYTKREDLKIGVFVDVQNMFYAAKKNYESRLDYMKLLRFAVKGRH